MRRLIAVMLLVLSLQASADEHLFYQPLNRDAQLSQEQWRSRWKASAAQGGKTLIVQWSAYGDSDFGGARGWLANSLRLAHEQGLQLVLGLYMDAAYYQRIDALDGAGLAAYWKAQLGNALAQQRKVRQDWQLPVAGWYLPMELDDLHFHSADRRQALYTQLQAFNRRLDAPLHISAFSTGRLSPAVNARWLEQLASLNVQVWWHDGAGSGRLAPLVRQSYLDALPCSIGIVNEAFRQPRAAGQPVRAVAAQPPLRSACHPRAVSTDQVKPPKRL
ncbi:DUF4434 domain-containing protein [Pseudomonas donghuensis]|uniref:DUF4434 domain-containing protein n=1 Tax=Pseudomonas donghuensis TaxID=1163398 RepID=A0AAP0X5G2_9PSED|nr:DUF4434 domain-containing protein [Pseudomonas donghuensis]KDN97064.1 DUF4434 domain-containing protein [Pseudomonas donghuensis]MCP6692546.1 DUF4434 domain-containing protein [Pseudomonas donghuensis]MCP6697781.1 DUF4434 domain-containing protein [Pseudomonas donghuensis]MDF9893798.1 hypothetical protein [Pseudomonas vranovensis]